MWKCESAILEISKTSELWGVVGKIQKGWQQRFDYKVSTF